MGGQPGYVEAGDYAYTYDANGNVGQLVAWSLDWARTGG